MLKRVKLAILVILLPGWGCCGAMVTGLESALAPLAAETWAVTRTKAYHPEGVTLRITIDCSRLRRFKAIEQLHLSPIDRKW